MTVVWPVCVLVTPLRLSKMAAQLVQDVRQVEGYQEVKGRKIEDERKQLFIFKRLSLKVLSAKQREERREGGGLAKIYKC